MNVVWRGLRRLWVSAAGLIQGGPGQQFEERRSMDAALRTPVREVCESREGDGYCWPGSRPVRSPRSFGRLSPSRLNPSFLRPCTTALSAMLPMPSGVAGYRDPTRRSEASCATTYLGCVALSVRIEAYKSAMFRFLLLRPSEGGLRGMSGEKTPTAVAL